MDIELLSNAVQTHLRPSSDTFSVLFSIGNFNFSWYALLYILGFFISIIIGCIVLQYRYKIHYDILFWYTFILIPCAIIGARFWSAMIGDLDWSNFFNFKSGGLAIQGGVIFAGIAGVIYFMLMLRRPKYHVQVVENGNTYICRPSLWIILDVALPLILFGQAIGRWGNFFNGEIFGPETSAESLTWLKNIMPGVYDHMQAVVPAGVNSDLVNGAFYQPLFLYESFTNIICFIIVYFLIPNYKKVKIGVIGSSYFLIYGVIRFAFEPLRFQAYKFTGTYILNGLLLAFGIILIIIAQFIAPRYRNKEMWYMFWIKRIRIIFIKIGAKFNAKWTQKYTSEDPRLVNYGYRKVPTFIRTESNQIYYAYR